MTPNHATLSLGQQPPLQVAPVPPFIGIWAAMGPGVIWGAMAMGSGELIWWPYVTAKYGAAFLGLLLPACLMQYFVNQEILRYTAATGEGLFQGFARVHRGFAGLMWLMLIMSFFWFGGYASGGGTALQALTDFPPGWDAKSGAVFWAYVLIALSLLALVLGKVVYRVIERLMLLIASITIAGLFSVIWFPEILATAGDFFRAYFNPFHLLAQGLPSNWDPKDASAMLTGIAFAGMGGFFNVMYSYWIRDKGLAMASYQGRVTSPVTGIPERISPAGFAFADTEDNRRHWHAWLRYLRIDNGMAVGVNLVTVMIMAWLAWALLLPKGEVPSGWKLVVTQSEFFGFAWGPVGAALFLLVAAAYLGKVWLGVADACSRMHADFVLSTFSRAHRFGFRTWYYVFVAILTTIALITIPLATPETLLLLQGVFNFLSMAIYTPVLIYMNAVMLPKAYPRWVGPNRFALFSVTLVALIYLGIAIWYLLVI